jgi:hypothetical protein
MSELSKATEEISFYSRTFPQAAFEIIVAHKEEAIPILRDSVEKAMAERQELEDGYQLHFYSLFLLGEFQDRDFFPRILEFACLPGDVLDYLIGDTITSGLSDILYNTYNGDLCLLKRAIRNPSVDEFARSSMLDVMGQLYKDGILDEADWKDFIRECIHSGEEYSFFYNALGSMICGCHFVDLLSEIRFLQENDLYDDMTIGGYDDCVDSVYSYRFDKVFCNSPISTINKLKGWAMFDQQEKSKKETEKSLKKALKTLTTPQKIGRNDPCPCGSGKKYKHCCLRKPKSPLDKIEPAVDREKCLEDYPYIGDERVEGRVYLKDYYDDEAIEIDRLVYLGLKRRPTLVWTRNVEKETKRCLEYLSLAFDAFSEKVEKEQITSFEEYDKRFSIHYYCAYWMGRLLRISQGELREKVEALYHAM